MLWDSKPGRKQINVWLLTSILTEYKIKTLNKRKYYKMKHILIKKHRKRDLLLLLLLLLAAVVAVVVVVVAIVVVLVVVVSFCILSTISSR